MKKKILALLVVVTLLTGTVFVTTSMAEDTENLLTIESFYFDVQPCVGWFNIPKEYVDTDLSNWDFNRIEVYQSPRSTLDDMFTKIDSETVTYYGKLTMTLGAQDGEERIFIDPDRSDFGMKKFTIVPPTGYSILTKFDWILNVQSTKNMYIVFREGAIPGVGVATGVISPEQTVSIRAWGTGNEVVQGVPTYLQEAMDRLDIQRPITPTPRPTATPVPTKAPPTATATPTPNPTIAAPTVTPNPTIVAPTATPDPVIVTPTPPVVKPQNINKAKVTTKKINVVTKKITGTTIAKATVKLMSGKKVIKKVTSNKKGAFTLKGLKLKKYKGKSLKILISKKGYKDKTVKVGKVKK